MTYIIIYILFAHTFYTYIHYGMPTYQFSCSMCMQVTFIYTYIVFFQTYFVSACKLFVWFLTIYVLYIHMYMYMYVCIDVQISVYINMFMFIHIWSCMINMCVSVIFTHDFSIDRTSNISKQISINDFPTWILSGCFGPYGPVPCRTSRKRLPREIWWKTWHDDCRAPSDVCWWTKTINYRYIYHKP